VASSIWPVLRGLFAEINYQSLLKWMWLMTKDHWWIAFGLMGQLLFSARFVVQWLKSEKEKRSVIPTAFWYFSISGGIVLLTYALHKQDPVFILGQSLGLFIYMRNVQLIRKERKRLKIAASAESEIMVNPESASRQAA
jgi:lipid-A-disaccharide synthase-like uncharacterized protein